MFELTPTDPCESSLAAFAIRDARRMLDALPLGPCRTRLCNRLAAYEARVREWIVRPPSDAEQKAALAEVLDFCGALEDLQLGTAMCPTISDASVIGRDR